jgi:hypothetical protein
MKDKQFVIQEHETADGVHWDLMLELGETLTTFRLEEPPQPALLHPIRAVKIFDHPLRFLSYEGPVQSGTGRVHIMDRGTYRSTEWPDDLLTLVLDGTVLNGAFTLARTAEAEWRFASEGPNRDLHQSPR